MTTEDRTRSAAAQTRPRPARRLLDLFVGGAGLLLAGVPLLVLMLAVRLDSRGPALFRQIRLGERGRPFVLYKLRSMRTGASGSDLTTAGDPRITRLGGFLRRTSLDELPQLWHVVRGQMTLVGPRPETPALARRYPPECRWVLEHRPGLTGPAQVRLRDADVLGVAEEGTTEGYLTRIVPARTAIEAAFLADPTLDATLRVLADTVRHLLGRPVPER
ncbi:sugar transferase [Dactylosporangium sp. NPDC049140]|uniref:sugar transferase n=1 Tax=Dactylosporangium sp. NPDC049140 TaxID=3155647 RepID=UPI0033DCADE5